MRFIKNAFTTTLLVFLLIASIVLNTYFYVNPQITYSYRNSPYVVYYSNKTATQLEIEELQKVDRSQTSDIYVTGWIPDWDLKDGLTTLKAQQNSFDSISPFWLLPQEDGTIKEVLNNANPEILSFAKKNNIKIIPTVPLFDFELLSKILNNKESFERHINEILNRVDKYDYDGIDLDYEATSLSDKKLFFDLLERLSGEMKSRNKTFVFTVMPKWGNELSYPSLPQTRLVQDYKMIADLVDEFRIMTYDFFGRTTTEAGPIGPLEWLERVLQYTIQEGVPRSKIVLGVHTYAYDWSDRPVAPSVDLVNWYGNLANIQGLDPGDAYYYSAVEKVMKEYELKYEFNSVWGEAVGRYMFEGKQRIVVFPTQQSIDMRKKLAREYGIKGIAIWRVGDEGSLKY